LIFEDRFRGARARAHAPSGVGRGLYDCRTLLRRMGGEINLLPTPADETGAWFQVVLRVASGPERR
jgi:K+-sensing histidine kinase KdpD